MRVAFVHVESTWPADQLPLQRAVAKRMMQSVRKHIGCKVVQLTDPVSEDLGADETVRFLPSGKFFIPWLMELFASQPPETLFLDTDTVVQEDVSKVFDEDFDIALTGRKTRFAVYQAEGKDYHMPFNLGVVFSRAPRFWTEIRDRVLKHKDEKILAWWGAQIELWKIWNEPHTWKLIALDAQQYNYTPNKEDEDLTGKAIVHYKGAKRKHWHLEGGWQKLSDKREIQVRA